MPSTQNVPQSINRGNGYVINDHLRAKNSCVSRALGMFCVTSSPRHEIKSKLNLFFLPDTLAVRLLSSSFAFCLIYKFISKCTCNYARCYELMC